MIGAKVNFKNLLFGPFIQKTCPLSPILTFSLQCHCLDSLSHLEYYNSLLIYISASSFWKPPIRLLLPVLLKQIWPLIRVHSIALTARRVKNQILKWSKGKLCISCATFSKIISFHSSPYTLRSNHLNISEFLNYTFFFF